MLFVAVLLEYFNFCHASSSPSASIFQILPIFQAFYSLLLPLYFSKNFAGKISEALETVNKEVKLLG